MAVSFGIHTVVGLHHLHTKGTVMFTIELKQPFFFTSPHRPSTDALMVFVFLFRTETLF